MDFENENLLTCCLVISVNAKMVQFVVLNWPSVLICCNWMFFVYYCFTIRSDVFRSDGWMVAGICRVRGR